jgi:hypothetical protein
LTDQKRAFFTQKLEWILDCSPKSLALLCFLIFGLLGLTFGTSDDEAYYWAVSHHPDWASAYHPGGLIWVLFASRKLFSFLGEFGDLLSIRWLSAGFSALIVYFSTSWIVDQTSISGDARPAPRARGVYFFWFSFFFSVCWMMVPDHLLFLSLLLLWRETWAYCFSTSSRGGSLARFFFYAVIAMSSKISGVFLVFSAAVSVLLWGRHQARWGRALMALTAGATIGLLPTVIWNYQHDWFAVRYQLQIRHAAGLSLSRFGRFWLIQAILGGPVLWFGLRWLVKKVRDPLAKFAWIWILPPLLVYGLQPLRADFKPHWILVAFFPMALVLAAKANELSALARRVATGYALFFTLTIFSALVFPWISWLGQRIQGEAWQTKYDVTADLFGWDQLARYLSEQETQLGISKPLPVTASWYQAAGQAGFAVHGAREWTLMPRPIRDRDDWSAIEGANDWGVERDSGDPVGGQWPRLKRSVWFVASKRYADPPQYKQSKCIGPVELGTHRAVFGIQTSLVVGQGFLIWRCEPTES